MKTNDFDEVHALPALLKLANGEELYSEIEDRCADAKKSLRDLTTESKVSLATIWRMRKTKTVANLKPLVKIEKVFKRWGV
jgi:hypothetical protein